jgi:arylsulfatase A-like enzyme
MPLHRRTLYAAASGCLALAAFSVSDPAPTASGPGPRLVVIVSVDQMRADYVDLFQHQWRHGLRRLLDEGARFTQAAYPYANTVTCPGHASIATGTVPAVHGQILNGWWERASLRRVSCTEDGGERPVSYGEPLTGGHSARRLKVTTLADEMRRQLPRAPRVVSLSLKPRAAIMLAGRRGDAVTWLDEPRGEWTTSTAFAAAPVPYLTHHFARHPVRGDFGKTWTRMLPLAEYVYDDDPRWKTPPEPWGPSLPHVLTGVASTPDRAYYENWQSSPFADEALASMAVASVGALGLGLRDRIDYLGISFSALDKVGHDFGPVSHEVQDVLARLDRTLGLLLGELDARVGREHYVLGLTADHGVAPPPAKMAAEGRDAGRVDTRALRRAIEATLRGRWGEGTYVALVEYTEVYFAPGVYERLVADADTLAAVLDTITRTEGVWRVFRGDQLERDAARDTIAARLALSYVPDRSGDLIVVPREHWIMSSTGAATHGSVHAYDARVPLLLLGAPFEPGAYGQPVRPTDLAPTLAETIGVSLRRPHGRVLHEAMRATRFTRTADATR